MPKFISDDDMAVLESSQPKKNFLSDDDMAALEAVHARPGFIDKIKSIPSSLVQAGKTLLNSPQDVRRAKESPGEAASVAARGLASGASYLDIPEGLKLEGEKVIAKNLPEFLGGMSDEDYQNVYGRGDDQALINQNMIQEAKSRAKFPAIDLISRGTGFVAGGNPASMVLKSGTQSASRAFNEGESIPSALMEGGQDALINAGLTYGPQAVAKIPSALNRISGKLSDTAETLAENATGATGIQKAKFREGTGRELLDRGIVSFADNPAAIADKAAAAQQAAGDAIQSALEQLDQKGVKASIPNVVDALEQKVAELKSVPGNDSIISKIQNEIENLAGRGQSEIPVSQGELAKRNYADSVNYFSPQADQKAAYHAAGAFRGEVERAAEAADPKIASTFKTAKDTYGLLAPVEEASAKRANQLEQHPFGGLGDMMAAGVSGGVAHVPMAAGVAAKRALFPRLSSSLAVSSDWLSKKLQINPQGFGKYAKPLSEAAARGGNALGVTHYLLQSIDPEYQKLMQKNEDDTEGAGGR
jgi:hypothetical protein